MGKRETKGENLVVLSTRERSKKKSERMPARIVVALACVVVMLQLSEAAVYKVGDSAGWTTIANVDYKQWASTKTFHIGDTVSFEYNPQFHNVMRVTHAMYRSCNSSNPISTFTTGNDSITLTNHGHHFFFCGVPGHCLAGQKLDLNVIHPASSTPLSNPRISSDSSSPSSPPSTTIPAAGVPGPSPSHAASLPNGAAAVVALLVFLVFACLTS